RLLCNLALQSSDLTTIKVTWKKDNETIIANNTIANKKENQNILSDQHHCTPWQGSSSCQFQVRNTTFKANFLNCFCLFLVPAVEGKEKPIISYEGDSVVLICQSANYTPVEWVWYMSNGNAVSSFQMNDKYEVTGQHTNKTKLKVQKILEKDGGWYHCQAVFKLGESKGKVNIKVLSYMVPLKPFFAIAAEVVILVAIILLYEMYSKKKQTPIDEKEFEQIEQL
uniref:Embigin n=1 Tax=Sphenodon punctatus TaxID=8508 RepID=A0A8D0L2X0_SPHPU